MSSALVSAWKSRPNDCVKEWEVVIAHFSQVFWTSLGLRTSRETALSSFVSTLPMNNCNSFSTHRYLQWKRYGELVKKMQWSLTIQDIPSLPCMKSLKEGYAKEGLEGVDITYTDNRPVLQLFLDRPVGLLSLLDEQCRANVSDLMYRHTYCIYVCMYACM